MKPYRINNFKKDVINRNVLKEQYNELEKIENKSFNYMMFNVIMKSELHV